MHLSRCIDVSSIFSFTLDISHFRFTVEIQMIFSSSLFVQHKYFVMFGCNSTKAFMRSVFAYFACRFAMNDDVEHAEICIYVDFFYQISKWKFHLVVYIHGFPIFHMHHHQIECFGMEKNCWMMWKYTETGDTHRKLRFNAPRFFLSFKYYMEILFCPRNQFNIYKKHSV